MGDMEELQVNTPTAREMINTVYGEINNQRAILLNTDCALSSVRRLGNRCRNCIRMYRLFGQLPDSYK